MTDDPETPFQQIVFSGGGTRCFWQGGFMDVVRDELDLSPDRMTGVSGGALAGACYIAHRGHDLLDRMRDAFSKEDVNVTADDLNDEDGRTVHQRVYRKVVSDVLDREAERAVANGPSFQILLAHPPSSDWHGLAGTAMTAAYEAELHLVNSPHFDWAEKFGLAYSLIDANEAARNGRLAELVCISATIPPLFRVRDWDGQPVIDGGMADQAPMPEPDEGETLVLLTRQYKRLPSVAGRHYVAPSEDVPADKIDFTDPDGLTEAWDLGLADGRRFVSKWKPKEEE